MAPHTEINVEDAEPMSRTYQYRKVMKPMLERKRRARMNKCLDDLKDLMVGALQQEGESITKLEKADVLELTVNHLKKLKRHNALSLPSASHTQEQFNNGFRQCTSEVTKFITSSPGIDIHISNRLLGHLGGCMNSLDKFAAAAQQQSSQIHQTSSPNITPQTSPITVSIPSKMYTPPASPDNARQMTPPVNHQINHSSPPPPQSTTMTSTQSYRVPQSQVIVPSTVVNNKTISNIKYKTAANQHYQQQQQQQVQQQLQQQHQQQLQQQTRYYQQNNSQSPSAAPPSPPLSVGSPSPVLVIRQVPQHPQRISTASVQAVVPAQVYIRPVSDENVWRPW